MSRLIQRSTPTKEFIDREFPIAETYAALEFYYHNNGMYLLLQQDLITNGLWTEGMTGLRNPAHRTVEFYVAKLWPGNLIKALPIVTKNEKILEPIRQIWRWGNWSVEKQVFARWFSLFGDGFLKVATRSGADNKINQVYFQNIKPVYVTELALDDRKFITRIRIDVPQIREGENEQPAFVYHTEIWDKRTQTYKRWENSRGPSAGLKQLGAETENKKFSDFGIDFVPIVHTKFQDTGEIRGVGSFVHALDKIDEANRMATRLHSLIFRYNDPIFAVRANAMDSSGRPLPAPAMNFDTDPGSIEGSKMKFARLPGNSSLESLVPDLKYSEHLEILNAHMLELEQDLPELAYYRMRSQSRDLSGAAVRLLLSDAIDKVVEARGNAESGLVRANEMALTIGVKHGIFDKGIGSYENGDFEHSFAERDVITLSETEKRQIALMDDSLGVSKQTNLSKLGYDPAVEEAQRAAEGNSLGESLLTNFEKGQ